MKTRALTFLAVVVVVTLLLIWRDFPTTGHVFDHDETDRVTAADRHLTPIGDLVQRTEAPPPQAPFTAPADTWTAVLVDPDGMPAGIADGGLSIADAGAVIAVPVANDTVALSDDESRMLLSAAVTPGAVLVWGSELSPSPCSNVSLLDEASRRIRIEIPRVVDLRITVRQLDGRPVQGAHVDLRPDLAVEGKAHLPSTDESGVALARISPATSAESISAVVRASGYCEARIEIPIDNDRADCEVALPRVLGFGVLLPADAFDYPATFRFSPGSFGEGGRDWVEEGPRVSAQLAIENRLQLSDNHVLRLVLFQEGQGFLPFPVHYTLMDPTNRPVHTASLMVRAIGDPAFDVAQPASETLLSASLRTRIELSLIREEDGQPVSFSMPFPLHLHPLTGGSTRFGPIPASDTISVLGRETESGKLSYLLPIGIYEVVNWGDLGLGGIGLPRTAPRFVAGQAFTVDTRSGDPLQVTLEVSGGQREVEWWIVDAHGRKLDVPADLHPQAEAILVQNYSLFHAAWPRNLIVQPGNYDLWLADSSAPSRRRLHATLPVASLIDSTGELRIALHELDSPRR